MNVLQMENMSTLEKFYQHLGHKHKQLNVQGQQRLVVGQIESNKLLIRYLALLAPKVTDILLSETFPICSAFWPRFRSRTRV